MVLAPYLVTTNNMHQVCYGMFLKRYVTNRKLTKKWTKEVISQVAAIIYNSALDLDSAFSKWDTDKDGALSYIELNNALLLECHLNLTADQITNFMIMVDRDHDGYISPQDFHRCFDREWLNVVGAAKWLNEARQNISQKLSNIEFEGGLRTCFRKYNTTKNGKMSIQEFKFLAKDLLSDLEFSDEDLEAIFGYLDVDDSKHITVKQFRRAFGPTKKPKRKTPPGVADENAIIMQQVIDVMSQYRLELQKEFRAIDVERSGTVTVEEFKAVISATNQQLDKKLSTHQLSHLFEQLDVDSYGFVLYEEFLSACEAAVRLPMPPQLAHEQEVLEKLLSDV